MVKRKTRIWKTRKYRLVELSPIDKNLTLDEYKNNTRYNLQELVHHIWVTKAKGLSKFEAEQILGKEIK